LKVLQSIELANHKNGKQKTLLIYYVYTSVINLITDCRPMQVWLVSRHGTRYPSRKKIEELKKLNELKTMITAESTMCPEDIVAIKNWDTNLTKDDHYMLQRQGVEELKSLGARLKRQFPQIFNNPYTEANFKVRRFNFKVYTIPPYIEKPSTLEIQSYH